MWPILPRSAGARRRRGRRGCKPGHRRPRVPHLSRRSATKSRRAPASRCTRRCPTITAPARGTRSAAPPWRRGCSASTADTTRQALGVAEYFGPRGQILRACDSPTMVKDGSGWGAHVGVTAALLARDGFTGAPALTVERDDATRVLERSRHALADPRAVLQGVPRLPLGAAGRRSGARAATRARLRGGGRRVGRDRKLPRGDRARFAVRSRPDDRGGAIQPAVPGRRGAGVGRHRRPRGEPAGARRPARRALAGGHDADRGRARSPRDFPRNAGRACASRSPTAACWRPSRRARAATRKIRSTTASCTASTLRCANRCWARDAQRASSRPRTVSRPIARQCRRFSDELLEPIA